MNFVNWLRIAIVVAVENVADVVVDTLAVVAFAAFVACAVVDFVVALNVVLDSLDLDRRRPLPINVGSIVLVASIDGAANCPIVEAVDFLFRLHFGHARALVVYRMNHVDRVVKTIFD